ncbi:Spx/MgsR family RNA polymerase-binding regulatory protein [Pararhodonellum marinum]|uniref:Spx/MgsR family RNA polymerase-binding regulatory protein n=1 Tax=Pararhodonellum marinum TaxID=2755358 RepID=UPI00188F20BA|nr:Spx/MgsR family RNA polymerase-binding regulatory protein [Pararhodonellum marinum]
MLKIYGIKNCNTMKNTFAFLEEEGFVYEFLDYKKVKPDENLLKAFLEKVAFEDLVNKRGTTYRKLAEEEKAILERPNDQALSLLSEKNSMIKRPLIIYPNGSISLGFDEATIKEKMG